MSPRLSHKSDAATRGGEAHIAVDEILLHKASNEVGAFLRHDDPVSVVAP